jgi:hypothetical protein
VNLLYCGSRASTSRSGPCREITYGELVSRDLIRANLFLNNSGEHSLAHELTAPTGPSRTILSVLVSTPNDTSASPISALPVPVTRAQAWTRTTPPSLPRSRASIKTRQLHRPWHVYAAGIRSSDAAASCLRVSAAVNRKLHARTHRPQIESA